MNRISVFDILYQICGRMYKYYYRYQKISFKECCSWRILRNIRNHKELQKVVFCYGISHLVSFWTKNGKDYLSLSRSNYIVKFFDLSSIYMFYYFILSISSSSINGICTWHFFHIISIKLSWNEWISFLALFLRITILFHHPICPCYYN